MQHHIIVTNRKYRRMGKMKMKMKQMRKRRPDEIPVFTYCKDEDLAWLNCSHCNPE
jgi:hypothetical protein